MKQSNVHSSKQMGFTDQITIWTQVLGKPVSKSEYEEICQNLSKYYAILEDWQKGITQNFSKTKT